MSVLSDAQMLKKVPLPEVRQTIAVKVAEYLNDGVFDESELATAFEIVRLLAKDAEIIVRKTVSECLKSNPKMPHDIALGLAKDEDDVAIPILEFCSVLTEEDLIEIIKSTKQLSKLSAIAKRKDISDNVSSALIHTRDKEVVITLVDNKTSQIAEEGYDVVLGEFKNNGGIIQALVHRGNLPVSIAEKMINMVSGPLKEKLQMQYKLSVKRIDEIMSVATERATLGILDNPIADENIGSQEMGRLNKAEQLAKQLQKENRLTHSIIIRSICEGDLEFFEASSAIVSGIPLINARTLVRDKNPTALESLCKRAKLPLSCNQAIYLVIKFILAEGGKEKHGSTVFKQKLLEHIAARGYEKTVPLMPYILALISSRLDFDDVLKNNS